MTKDCWERLRGYSVWVSADGMIIVTRETSPGEVPDVNRDAALLQRPLQTASLIGQVPTIAYAAAAATRLGMDVDSILLRNDRSEVAVLEVNLLRACGPEQFDRWAYTILEKLGRQCEKRGDRAGAIAAFEEIFKAYPRYAIVAENTTVEDKLRTLRLRQ